MRATTTRGPHPGVASAFAGTSSDSGESFGTALLNTIAASSTAAARLPDRRQTRRHHRNRLITAAMSNNGQQRTGRADEDHEPVRHRDLDHPERAVAALNLSGESCACRLSPASLTVAAIASDSALLHGSHIGQVIGDFARTEIAFRRPLRSSSG